MLPLTFARLVPTVYPLSYSYASSVTGFAALDQKVFTVSRISVSRFSHIP
jgi:hypothetical protein